MKYLYLTLILLHLSINTGLANVGVFTGSGHSIELSSTESVQMVSEEVTIIPGRGRYLFNGGVSGMDRVEYHCVFVLKNRKNSKVNIKVGFPLNSQFLNPPYGNNKKTSELVSQYNFISQTDEQQYSVRYTPGDKEKKLKNLFLWDMAFEPYESKTLQVTYSMPISMTLASAAINLEQPKYAKDWYQALESCMLELFGYVTETGKSWAGTIEKATFKVYVKGFEDYISNRPLLEGVEGEELVEAKKQFPVWKPIIHRIIEPDKWEIDDEGFLIKTFNNYKAENNITFYYYILTLPKITDDAENLISHLEKSEFSSEDIQDLMDILKEFNGEKTNNKRIQSFLENQRWYGKGKIETIPSEVIEYISNIKR